MSTPPHLLPRRHVHDAHTWTWRPELAAWVGTCACGTEIPASLEQARYIERAVDEHLAASRSA